MGRVRQKDTTPELAVRKGLHAMGYRYVLHPKSLPGKPDIAFPRHCAVIFVHGCFWHGHDCRAGRSPSSNADLWAQKIAANRTRDAKKTAELIQKGWRVFAVWECETKGFRLDETLTRLSRQIGT